MEYSIAQIESALMTLEHAVSDIERLIVDEEADDLPVGHVDQRLSFFGVPVAGLRVGQGQRLVEAVEVRAGQGMGFAFVEIAAQADVAVRQCEDRFRLTESIEVQDRFGNRPGLDGEGVGTTHVAVRSSARSSTTMSAP